MKRYHKSVPTGRFAPSPTGRLHIGNLRTAVVAWLWSRYDNSQFLLRFEDLDERTVAAEHYKSQQQDLQLLGLDWDDPIVNQTDRLDIYHDVLSQLVSQDLVYPCFCSRREIREAASAPHRSHAGPHYPGTCADLSSAQRSERAQTRSAALRIRGDENGRGFSDLVLGDQHFAVDDLVVQRNDGTPAYHLVVVVDDAASNIEVVVRADDLTDSTSRHLFLYELLGYEPPQYAHVPLVLAPNGDRLAKRHGAVTLEDRAGHGETPADVLSYLAASLNLCQPGEMVTASELRQRFDPAGLPTEPLVLEPNFLAD